MKRVKIVLVVLAVALVCVVAWQAWPPRETEPSYRGQPLSDWLRASASFTGGDQAAQEKVNAAVSQLGTNALPTLLRLLRTKDSPLKTKFIGLLRKQHLFAINHIPAEALNSTAASAFGALRAKAESAVPALIEIVQQNISPESQYCAIRALGYIGPPAKDAIPLLLQCATNANEDVRGDVSYALGRLQAEPERVLPVLTNALQDQKLHVRLTTLFALREFGPRARIAVPALIAELKTPILGEAHEAGETLKAIDPEAAAKTGIK